VKGGGEEGSLPVFPWRHLHCDMLSLVHWHVCDVHCYSVNAFKTQDASMGERLCILSLNRSEKIFSQLESVVSTMTAQFLSEYHRREAPPNRSQDLEHILRVSGCLEPCIWKRCAVHTVLPNDDKSEGSLDRQLGAGGHSNVKGENLAPYLRRGKERQAGSRQ